MKFLKLTAILAVFITLLIVACNKKSGNLGETPSPHPVVPKSITINGDVMTVVYPSGKKVVVKAGKSFRVGDKVKNIFALGSNRIKGEGPNAKAMSGFEWPGDPNDPGGPGDPNDPNEGSFNSNEEESTSDPLLGPPLYVATGATILTRNGRSYAASGLYLRVEPGNITYTDAVGNKTVRNVVAYNEYNTWWLSGSVVCYWSCDLNWRWSWPESSQPSYSADTYYSTQRAM